MRDLYALTLCYKLMFFTLILRTVYNYPNSSYDAVAGCHEEKLYVYNYRNSTYDSCKLKSAPMWMAFWFTTIASHIFIHELPPKF